VGGPHAKEIAGQRRKAEQLGHGIHRRCRCIAADLRVANQRRKIGGFGQRRPELFEIGFDSRNCLVLRCQFIERSSVSPLQAGRNAAGILHAPWFPKSVMLKGQAQHVSHRKPLRRGRA
jgi:hypothetical protein